MSKIQFPMTPEDLGRIANANALAAGCPFPSSVDRALGDGITTCLIHRQHEWHSKWFAPLMPLCEICGGRCDPRHTAHALCLELKKRDLPTPPRDSFHRCACMKCCKAARANSKPVNS